MRTSEPPTAIAPLVRAIIRKADPQQPISDVRTLADVVGRETLSREAQVRVLGAFAAVAFLLGAVGIHGLLSFAVRQRVQEIGVRIALGAEPGDIVGMMMKRSGVLAVVGIVPGVAVAYACARSMQALLADVAPGDVLTFLAATCLVALMTLAGSLVPTLRALWVDPITAIRTE